MLQKGRYMNRSVGNKLLLGWNGATALRAPIGFGGHTAPTGANDDPVYADDDCHLAPGLLLER